jgi:hypothetical protein
MTTSTSDTNDKNNKSSFPVRRVYEITGYPKAKPLFLAVNPVNDQLFLVLFKEESGSYFLMTGKQKSGLKEREINDCKKNPENCCLSFVQENGTNGAIFFLLDPEKRVPAYTNLDPLNLSQGFIELKIENVSFSD